VRLTGFVVATQTVRHRSTLHRTDVGHQ
jgi:hypothetical protein